MAGPAIICMDPALPCYPMLMDVSFLNEIEALPRLLCFSGVDFGVSLAQLRGVWGRALGLVAPRAFAQVFDGALDDANRASRPGYVLADQGTDRDGLRRVRWTLLGRDALAHDATLCLAWMRAGQAGVGDHGNYASFAVQSTALLGPDGAPSACGTSWRMDALRWPLAGDPVNTPCQLVFPGGLCLTKKVNGRKIRVVANWPEITRTTRNRLRTWLPETSWPALDAAKEEWDRNVLDHPLVDHTTEVALSGYSRRQENESGDGRKTYLVREGTLEFPAGLGEGWPLMLAMGWLGLGDHFTEGMGWCDVKPL